ncbi:hypothetical protein [Methanocorpusculum labreanum]|uniref:hypothetical protein n=1 Tax=Methanocorpusculum labreanum TaxID=83984 RepID=UPI00064FC5C0|nr:hypothetical protein [Methanocorpusculum labreanum]
MVISRDRKKVRREETSSPAVKETNWNFLVIVLSTIMVFIGVPSMFSACFSDSMEAWGTTIFLICASVIAFFLGILYCYIPSILLKIPFSGRAAKLHCFYIALTIAFIPLVIYYSFTGHVDYVLIYVICVCFLFLIGQNINRSSEMCVSFNKLPNLWQLGLTIIIIGGVICLIGVLAHFNILILGGIGFMILGDVLYIIGSLPLLKKIINEIWCNVD